MVKEFEFSYCLGEVEEITDMENITEQEGEDIVIKLVKSDEIYVGERTKGRVSFDDNVQPIVYDVDYEFCTGLGVDWSDDVWEEQKVQVQL